MPGECSKAGILDHVGQRRCGMMTDNRMQRHLGEAHLPKRVQKLREILFGCVANPSNSDAVEQLRTSANSDCRKAQCATCRECGEVKVFSIGRDDVFRGARARRLLLAV